MTSTASTPSRRGRAQTGSKRQQPLPVEANPFPGGRPFRREESGCFHGRAAEAVELSAIVEAHACVMLYAPSGAGKSSLIHAGLIPALKIPDEQRRVIDDQVRSTRESDASPDDAEATESGALAEGEADLATESGPPVEGEAGLATESDGEIPVGVETVDATEPDGGAPVVIETDVAARYFDVLGVTAVHPGSVRTADGWPSADEVRNVYTTAAVQYLRGTQDLTTSLAEYVARQPIILDEFGDPFPRLLVIDQFEEILEPYGRDDWLKCRDDFMEELAGIVGGSPPLHVLISIREDHLATIERLSARAGLTFGARFRLDKLRSWSALRSIEIPARESGLPFAPAKAADEDGHVEKGVAEQLLDQLALRKMSGIPKPIPGEFIEPAQLQVVCRQVWAAANAKPPKPGKERRITRKHLEKIGGVEGALGVQYENAIEDVSSSLFAQRGTERAVRRFFEDQLISDGTRQLVPFNRPPRRKRDQLTSETFRSLEQEHNLIRSERRGGTSYWELSHDGFIEPIQKSNRAFFERRRSMQLSWAWGIAVVVSLIVALTIWLAARSTEDAPGQLERLAAPVTEVAGSPGELMAEVSIGRRDEGVELVVELAIGDGVAAAEFDLLDATGTEIVAVTDRGLIQDFKLPANTTYDVLVSGIGVEEGMLPPSEILVLVRENSHVVQVPDVLGQSAETASDSLTGAGLVVSFVASDCYDPDDDVRPDAVVRVVDGERASSAGVSGVILDFNESIRGVAVYAAEGSTVSIETYNGSTCLTAEAPGLVGSSVEDAQAALTEIGLEVAASERLPALALDCTGHELEVRGISRFGVSGGGALAPGEQLAEGTLVTLWATSGCRTPPDVYGLSEDDSQRSLEADGYVVQPDVELVCSELDRGRVRQVFAVSTRAIGSSDVARALIVDRPGIETRLTSETVLLVDSTTVALTVSSGRTCTIPPVLGLDLDAALAELSAFEVQVDLVDSATCDAADAVVLGVFDASTDENLLPASGDQPDVADDAVVRLLTGCLS